MSNSMVSQTLPKPASGYSDPRRKDAGGKKRGFSKNPGAKDRAHRNKTPNGSQPANSSNSRKPSNNNRKKPASDDADADAEAYVESRVQARQSDAKYQHFTAEEIAATGPLVPNPESLGFRRKNTRPREVSKFLQSQPRLLVPMPFVQHAWDKQNQLKMVQMEQTGMDNQGLYELFQKMRDTERKEMETLGLVDAENIRKDLNDAISFQGTCLDMCPTFERVRRALENNVKALEKDPATNKIARDRAVKAFSRPAAGQPPPLPSDVRPPHILKSTLDYLVTDIVPKLPEAHSFIWDRTRSIRQDFTYQNYFGPEAIDCNERIVRIHLLCLHVMAGSDVEYSQQQELEQFNKALQTLVEIYQDVRNRGGSCPNEAEFRAYYLLSHIKDAEVERELQTLPDAIFNDSLIQLALKIRKIAAQNNIIERGHKNTIGCLNLFVEFFRLVYSKETPFLVACLLETHFNEIRFYALKAMSRGYHSKGKPYDAETLKSMLGFDTLGELVKFVEYYEIDVIQDEKDGLLVDLFNKEKLESKYKLNALSDKPKYTQAYSLRLNEKIDAPLAAFVNRGKPNDDLHLKNVKDMDILKNPKPPAVKQEKVKGSFADFLSSNSGASGFSSGGFPPVSQPAETKPTNFSTSKPPPAFGKPPPIQTPTQPPQPKPAFGFANTGNAPTLKTEVPSVSFKSEKPETKPFSFSVPEPKPSTPAPTSVPPPQFSFKEQPKVVEVKRDSLQPMPASSALSIAVPPPAVPQPPKPKMLVDLPKFSAAAQSVYQDIMAQVVNEELGRILPTVIRKENTRHERSRVIESLSKQLYDAFLNEIVFKQILEVKADKVYQRNLKIKTIRKINRTGEKLQQKQILTRRRLNELSETKFGGLKRQVSNSSNASFSSNKRRHVNESIDEIIEKRSELEKLWAPLDMRQFLSQCSDNVKLNIEMKNLEVKFLVIVENWRSTYSRWLSNKLQLTVNKQRMVYENVLRSDKVNLDIISLPPKDQLNKTFFKNTGFLVFEFGITDDSHKDIREKLAKDRNILKKIVELADKHGRYKVQIMILFWDTTKSGISQQEAKLRLGLEAVAYSNVKQLVFCDMTRDVNESLESGLKQLSSKFNGDMTLKGRRSGAMEHPKIAKPTVSNDKFKENERKLLHKARMDKKYSYLSNHSMINSVNHTNTTMMNNSLLRHTFNRSMNRRNDGNSTLFNVSTVLNNTNNSVLDGFGGGIIEESTPFSSPKKVLNARDKPTRSLQQLMELTRGVKSKYKS